MTARPDLDLRKLISWAHALVAALPEYYAWREQYDCEELYADRPCYWTWRRMHEKTLLEWRRDDASTN